MDRAAWVLAFARTTQNVRHRTFDTERVARAHDRGGRGSEYQMGAVGDHAFIQVFCPTPQAISASPKFVKLFNPMPTVHGVDFSFFVWRAPSPRPRASSARPDAPRRCSPADARQAPS